jgi:phage terminase Nu1 subunit (DNA packaging protein)
VPDVELIREACARELGRTQARDEMTELRKEVQELKNAVTKLTSVIASFQRDPNCCSNAAPQLDEVARHGTAISDPRV